MGGKFGRLKAVALGVLASALAVAYFAAGAGAHQAIYLDPAAGAGPAIAGTADGGVLVSLTFEGTLGFCRIDSGASTCAASGFIAQPSGLALDYGNWPFVNGNTLGLLDTRSDGSTQRKYFYTLTESGTLSATKEVAANSGGGSLAFSEAASALQHVITPGYFLATVNGGEDSEGATLAAAEATTFTPGSKFLVSKDPLGETSTASTTVSVENGMLSVAWIGPYGGPKIYWRRLSTPILNAGEAQNEGLWSAPLLVGEATSFTELRMASGAGGLYLAYQRPSDRALVVQPFNASNFTFDPPEVISEPNVNDYAIAEDPSGLLHIAYTLEGSDGSLHYSYAKSAANTAFTYPQILPEAEYRDLRLVADSGGGGWVSWLDDGTDSSFVMQLDPGEGAGPPAPPSGGSSGGGGSSSGGGAAKTTPKPVTVHGPTATTTSPLGHGLVGQLSVPKQCLPENATFGAKLAVKRKGTQAHKAAYSVTKVQFSIGGSSLSTDRKKPFEARFLTTGLKRDSALTVTAKVSVLLHLGHRTGSVTKSLTAKVRTCG
jgi:hypothetical protein